MSLIRLLGLLVLCGCASSNSADSAAAGGSANAGSTSGGGAGNGGAAFFVEGEFDGRSLRAEHNITFAVGSDVILLRAFMTDAVGSPYWGLNFVVPAADAPASPEPIELDCIYVMFENDEAIFSDRVECSITVTERAPAGSGGVWAGTFSAELREAGATSTFPVTTGQFRVAVE